MKSGWRFWHLVVIAVALWLATWVLSVHYLDKWEERSQFGGMFGAIGALFTGLALAGVVLTVREQRQQKFETTYLELIGIIWEAEADICVKDGDQWKDGFDALEFVVEKTNPLVGAQHVLDSLNKQRNRSAKESQLDGDKILDEALPDEASRIKDRLSPFLHALKVPLEFLDSAALTKGEKEQYAAWIPGYYTQAELHVIAFFALTDSKFKKLIEDFGVLRNMQDEFRVGAIIADNKLLKKQFDPRAFIG